MTKIYQETWDVALGPIRKVAVHEQIVARLRRAIHLGDFAPGDRLLSERDIAERMEVSRESVREAFQVLERDGYVVSRRGPTGGHTVTTLRKPAAKALERLNAERDGLTQLMEFRRANECLAARLAACRRTRSDVKAMHRSISDLRNATDIAEFRRADANFHLAVAAAARNSYVERAVLDSREAVFLIHENLNYRILIDSTYDGHNAIADAIEAKDGAAADAAMAQHMVTALAEIRQVLSAAKRQRKGQ